MSATTEENCIKACNDLLQGEISAIETYSQVVHKHPDHPSTATLEKLRGDHLDISHMLRENVRRMGGQPATDSGAWGGFAKSVQGAANLLGDESAIQSLIRGEEHGIKQYERALEHDGLMAESKSMIRETILPRSRTHLKALDSIKHS